MLWCARQKISLNEGKAGGAAYRNAALALRRNECASVKQGAVLHCIRAEGAYAALKQKDKSRLPPLYENAQYKMLPLFPNALSGGCWC